MSEPRRVASVADGDAVAAGAGTAAVPSFDELFASEYRRVVGLAFVLCGRRGVAEDIAQEAFTAAYRRWSRISHYDDPAAWVRRVAVNAATSVLRRRAREARAMARIAARREYAVDPVLPDAGLWEAVRDLPGRQARCVALRYLEDRSVADIAAVLGIAEATVRVHLHKARMTLAERLGEDAGDVALEAVADGDEVTS